MKSALPASPLGADELAKGGNRLLARLSERDLAFIARGCQRISWQRDAKVIDAGRPAQAALFIEQGVISISKPWSEHNPTEICLIGPESFLGSSMVLAEGQWRYDGFSRANSGRAIRVSQAVMRQLFRRSVSFRTTLTAAIHLQTLQITENLANNAWQSVAARLARWLLMFRDRARSNRLELTHEAIAAMVGAQRTRITEALHVLEGEGAISALRGCVIVRDPENLERLSNGGYGTTEREAKEKAPGN